MALNSKIMDPQLFWFLFVSLLLPAFAQKDSTDAQDGRKCFENNLGIDKSNIAGGICVGSTTKGR